MSINVIDITYGIYTSILLATDHHYKDSFILFELKWKSSVMCFLLMGIFLNFNLLSPLMLVFLALERLMVVIFPLKTKFKSTKYVFRIIFSTFGLCALLVCIFSFIVQMIYKTVPLNICSPFVNPSNSILLIKIITLFTNNSLQSKIF